MAWTDAQSREFGAILLAMGELFETPVSAARAELFVRSVEDLPYDAMRAAANQHARGGTFFPKPADLRRLVEGDVEDKAEQAWQHVLREVRRVGYMGKPAWPDAATERAALGLFGGSWRTLCENLPAAGPELLGFRKAFVAGYGAAARLASADALPPSRAEAAAQLADLTAALTQRGLPTGGRCGQMVPTGTGSTTCRRARGHDGACSGSR